MKLFDNVYVYKETFFCITLIVFVQVDMEFGLVRVPSSSNHEIATK